MSKHKYVLMASKELNYVHICGKCCAENENYIEHVIERVNISFTLNSLAPCWNKTVFSTLP